jgi:hypothetical protein
MAEMADRSHEERWDENLVQPPVDYPAPILRP